MKKSMILDVDTGVDDAFAILFAARHPDIKLLGITCVDGNTNLKNVVANTMKVLDAAEAGDIPVASGATQPLLQEPQYADMVHGADGLGDLGLPQSDRRIDSRNAIELMKDLIDGSLEPVTLIPLAPLTNIALFLRTYPESAKKLERIVLMGGSAAGGNATAAAEFNIWHDPEAAAVVFTSGVPLTMYGLDVFYDITVTKSDADTLLAVGGTAASLAGNLINGMVDRLGPLCTLGDYGAVAAALFSEKSESRALKVVVDTSFGPGRGQTICDRRREIERDDPHTHAPFVDVILKIDVEFMRTEWLKTVKPA